MVTYPITNKMYKCILLDCTIDAMKYEVDTKSVCHVWYVTPVLHMKL